MKDCLILVDLQKDYFPGGNMELAGTEKAAANAQLLLEKFREEKSPIVHIQHISTRPGAAFFLPGTQGAEIHEMVAPKEGEIVVVKNYPNSFRETPLLEILKYKKIHDLVICGAMSHMCIDASTRAAADLGFACILAHDACATRDLTFQEVTVPAPLVHAAYMSSLSGLYARILSTDEIIQGGFI
jgi:nicotinamidase-related amidase